MFNTLKKLNYSDPAVLRAVFMSVIGVAAALGVTLPSGLSSAVDSLVAVLAFVIPLIQGFWTRHAVVSPQTHHAKLAAAHHKK